MYSKALLNKVRIKIREELNYGHFDKHSPLLKLEYFRFFCYAKKSFWTAAATDQQEAQEEE